MLSWSINNLHILNADSLNDIINGVESAFDAFVLDLILESHDETHLDLSLTVDAITFLLTTYPFENIEYADHSL
jgi:hypothetical protein